MTCSVQGALQVSMLSPGFVYEPYATPEAIPFWKRSAKSDLFIFLNAYFILCYFWFDFKDAATWLNIFYRTYMH